MTTWFYRCYTRPDRAKRHYRFLPILLLACLRQICPENEFQLIVATDAEVPAAIWISVGLLGSWKVLEEIPALEIALLKGRPDLFGEQVEGQRKGSGVLFGPPGVAFLEQIKGHGNRVFPGLKFFIGLSIHIGGIGAQLFAAGLGVRDELGKESLGSLPSSRGRWHHRHARPNASGSILIDLRQGKIGANVDLEPKGQLPPRPFPAAPAGMAFKPRKFYITFITSASRASRTSHTMSMYGKLVKALLTVEFKVAQIGSTFKQDIPRRVKASPALGLVLLRFRRNISRSVK